MGGGTIAVSGGSSFGGATQATGGIAAAAGGSGTGGAPSTGGQATGGLTGTSGGTSTCVAGVQTGDSCDPAVDVSVCVRSDRDCTCDANTRQWNCVSNEGTGGSTGAGGSGLGGFATGGDTATGGETATGGVENTGGTTGTNVPLDKFVGNITTGNSVDTDGLTYADYWNQISPENQGKWGSVQSSAGSGFNWGSLDSIHDYTQQHGIIFKEHCFIWGAQQPSGTPSESDVKNWMQEFCSRYPDVAIIDVVNEPPPHTTPNYANNIGGGTNGDWAWIRNAFIWADEACPNAILLLNDYNNIEWPNDNQHFIDIVNTIKADGAPIDGIGAQAHDLDHGSVSFNTVQSLFNKLHDDTGLPIYITEMDISTTDDQAQLSAYQQYFPLFWEASFVPGITIWGWIYGRTWSMAPDSGLVRSGSPRPAMTWLMDQLGRPSP
jgi:endo-1,4-beta-xylanase